MADDLLSQIRLNGTVPRHVAVIMDGNGRWARERSLPRPLGHRAGMKAVREVVEGGLEAGLEVLTLFAFSEENWQRPLTEISALMRLLEEYIAREVAELKDQGVAVHVLGDRTRLAPGARAAVERIERETRGGARLALNLCISYSARGEMARNVVVRIGSAVTAIAGTMLMLSAGGWVLAGALAILGVLGTREVYDLARKQGIEPLEWIGFIAAALCPLATYWVKSYADW